MCTSEHGSRKALDYLAKIQAGLVRETRADVGYTNFITKNPMHEHWRTEVWTKEAYELNYLAEFVDLRPSMNKEKNTDLVETIPYLIPFAIGLYPPLESIEAKRLGSSAQFSTQTCSERKYDVFRAITILRNQSGCQKHR